jgi:hypothetical protein
MIFVLKRSPAFQLFGPFQTQSQARIWIKEYANERRYACCILEPIDPRHAPKGFVPADAIAAKTAAKSGKKRGLRAHQVGAQQN